MAKERKLNVVARKDFDVTARKLKDTESLLAKSLKGLEAGLSDNSAIQQQKQRFEQQMASQQHDLEVRQYEANMRRKEYDKDLQEAELSQRVLNSQAYYMHGQAEVGKVKQQHNPINMDLIWKVGAFALILFFFVGPSLSAILHILGSMNIWLWIGLILIGLIIWRART